jgi:hypothetical protein
LLEAVDYIGLYYSVIDNGGQVDMVESFWPNQPQLKG